MTNSFLYGVCYNPTWTTWSPPYSNTGSDAQFSDSDFFNDSFQALWNNSKGNTYRDDLAQIGTAFGLVRLYNWGATRGWNGTVGDAHIGFLDYAQKCGVQVMVPISNYFLSDDTYAWNGKDPDAGYSFDSAPNYIQAALSNFVSSVVTNGDIHSAVHSFSVGNEIDINTFVGQGSSGAVNPASRLARTIWWIVNLQRQISIAKYRSVRLTSPISHADQGDPQSGKPPLSYWCQALLNGVNTSTNLPEGTTGGSGPTFSAAWKGIGAIIGYYNLWYFNSVNIYQYGTGLTTTLGQYDQWSSTTVNSTNWPGQQFSVPLLLTEIGYRRATPSDQANQNTQYLGVTEDIATAIKNYRSSESRLMGYCLYEFSDEAYLNANWGLFMSGATSSCEPTGSTRVSYATWPSVHYPVDQLSPVTDSRTKLTLIDALKQIFT